MGEKFPPLNQSVLEKKSPELISFWNLSDQEKNVFKKRIQESQGELRIFVHPYYNYENTKDYTTETLVGLRDGFKKLVAESALGTSPILVLEEKENTDQLKSIIGNAQKQDLYYLPTLEGRGRLFPEQELPQDIQELHAKNEDRYHSRSFTFLSNKLKELGVSKIVLGGMFLDVYAPNGKTPPSLKEGTMGCASDALVELAKKFPVTVSKLSHPDYEDFVKHFGEIVGPKGKFENK